MKRIITIFLSMVLVIIIVASVFLIIKVYNKNESQDLNVENGGFVVGHYEMENPRAVLDIYGINSYGLLSFEITFVNATTFGGDARIDGYEASFAVRESSGMSVSGTLKTGKNKIVLDLEHSESLVKEGKYEFYIKKGREMSNSEIDVSMQDKEMTYENELFPSINQSAKSLGIGVDILLARDRSITPCAYNNMLFNLKNLDRITMYTDGYQYFGIEDNCVKIHMSPQADFQVKDYLTNESLFIAPKIYESKERSCDVLVWKINNGYMLLWSPKIEGLELINRPVFQFAFVSDKKYLPDYCNGI